MQNKWANKVTFHEKKILEATRQKYLKAVRQWQRGSDPGRGGGCWSRRRPGGHVREDTRGITLYSGGHQKFIP